MPPHPNHPCSRCQRQFGPDEVLFMAATEPNRYRNRIAIGQDWVGGRGCYRLMAPLVVPFRRTTCSPACAMRTERRRAPTPPPPTQIGVHCGHKFIPKHRDKALYCGPRCRHRRRMTGGWRWRGRTGLAADWRILLPSPGGEGTLLKIAAHCDDRSMTTRRFGARSLRTIARALNERSIRTPRGVGEWKAGTVAQLLARLAG